MIQQQKIIDKIESAIGFLFDKNLMDELLSVGKYLELQEGSCLLYPGDEVTSVPLIIEGAVKIVRENDEGEELLLYYIESGDTCATTLQCCMRKSKSEIKAVTMEPTSVLIVPHESMESWMNKYPSWRNFILESYHARLKEMMETIDSLTFKRLDERLDEYLKDQAKIYGSLELNNTHQQIAEDLHSSRVVISRLLKRMENDGLIELHRNRIVLKSI